MLQIIEITETSVALVTATVTLGLGVAGLVGNSWLQRRNNSISIITSKRLERRSEIEKLSASILFASDPDLLNISDANRKNEFLLKLTEAFYNLRTLLEFEFETDAKFVYTAYKVKCLCLMYVNEQTQKEQLQEARLAFSRQMDEYCLTEWNRIKRETVGKNKKNKKGYQEWKNYYSNSDQQFAKNEELHKELFL